MRDKYNPYKLFKKIKHSTKEKKENDKIINLIAWADSDEIIINNEVLNKVSLRDIQNALFYIDEFNDEDAMLYCNMASHKKNRDVKNPVYNYIECNTAKSIINSLEGDVDLIEDDDFI